MRSKSGFSFFYKITSSTRKKPSLSISKPNKIPESSGINKTIDNAAEIIEKWNTEYVSEENFYSLFRENKGEAKKFVNRVNELQNAMNLLIRDNPNSEIIIRAQKLMQIAMKRLQNEFRLILSTDRAHLDLESISIRSNDEDEEVSKSSTNALKSIAECMISAGYGKECASIYKSIRKSIVDESIYHLGVEKISSSKAKKMPYEVLELKMKKWIEAVKVSMKTIFDSEKSLCDEVFESSVSLKESCFREITKEGAILLFSFPETVAVRDKKHLHIEKIFLLLDMYCVITENLLAIESIFSFPSMLVIRTQAHSSLSRLSESILSHLVEFESEIRKDSSKIVVSGGDVHPITIFAMDYISKLSNYSNYLIEIFNRSSSSSAKSLLPKDYFDVTEAGSELKIRFAWLILVLLCKIDSKAEMYKDFSVQYIFLANNLQHVVSRVRSTNLENLLGEDWITKHVEKVKQFTRMYERLAWGSLVSLCPEINTSEAVEMSSEEANLEFEKFNEMFEKTYELQNQCVVSDLKLLEEIRISIGRKLLPVYRDFYNAYSNAVTLAGRQGGGNVRYTPEDIGKRLSELFNGKGISGNSYLCTADLCFVRTSSTTSRRKKRSSSCRRF